MTHPAPETLGLLAVGAGDPNAVRHVEVCSTCRAEVQRLREAAQLLRGQASSERRIGTDACLDEAAIADFVEGRLGPEARAPVVTHLLECAHCRAAVKGAGALLADPEVAREAARTATPRSAHRWQRWAIPIGVAAAAAMLVLVVLPRDGSTPELREPTLTSTVAPVPIAPRSSVDRVERLVWSDVPGAERYRLRIYDAEGSVVWTAETTDTAVALPDSVALTPAVSYFWRVEAESEWRRWAESDLVEFHVTGPR